DGPDLLMMLALADYAGADNWCWPGYDTLALRIRRDVKTVYRVLTRLEGDGAIRRLNGRIQIVEPEVLEIVAQREAERMDRAGRAADKRSGARNRPATGAEHGRETT